MPLLESPAKYRYFRQSWYKDAFGVTNSLTSAEHTIDMNRRNKVANPNFRVEIARGIDATTDYENTRLTLIPAYLQAATRHYPPSGYRLGTYRGVILDPAGLAIPEDTVLRDLALARLKRKLSSNVKDFQTFVPVAELREMRSLIRGAAQLTTGLLQSLLDIRKTRGKSALAYASRAWLAYSFGIKPIANDVEKLSASISEFILGSDRVLRLTGTASKDWMSGVKKAGVESGPNGLTINLASHFQHLLSYHYIAAFDIKVSSGNNYGVSDHFNLELGQLVPTFWELVPYSWIVDYFTTVGAFLDDTFSSPNGITRYVLLCKRYSVLVDQVNSYQDTASVPGYPLIVDYASASPGFIEKFHFKRTKLTSLPHRALRFKSIDEAGISTVNKLLNLASVLISRRS